MKSDQIVDNGSVFENFSWKQTSISRNFKDYIRSLPDNDIENILGNIPSAWNEPPVSHRNFIKWLIENKNPETIVELGVDYGYSSFLMSLYSKGKVYGIDSYDLRSHIYRKDDDYQFVLDISKKLKFNNFILIRDFFDNVAKTWDKPIDILHIDGHHSYENAKTEFNDWKNFVKDDGAILFHDTVTFKEHVGKFFGEIKDYHKINFLNSNGLGVISKNKQMIKDIKNNFPKITEEPIFIKEIIIEDKISFQIKNEMKNTQNKFNLVRIVPDNGFDIHAQVFHEIEASVFFTLQRMGYEVTNSVNEFKSNARNIVFGMHHCPVDVVRHDLPKNTIIYSLEQMRDQPECMRWCRKYRGLEVWDYSMRNTEVLRKAGVENIKHFKIGYVPELSYFERNRPEERDIDILAYMSPSQRRLNIMNQFSEDKNINFVAVQSTYGDERDKLIKRAKLVINLHNHDNEIFEMVRVSHLIQNKVPVISERNTTTDFPDYMEGTVNTASYKDFVAKTYELLKDVNKLDRQAEQGLEIFKKSPMENFLKEVL
jgi:hypothetical protein